jgi:integrase
MHTIERFGVEYQAYKGLSAGRRQEQTAALVALATHAGCLVEDVTPAQFRSYLATLVARNLSAGYVVKIRRMILPFFTWARQAGLIEFQREQELREVPAPVKAVPKVTPRPYTREELDAFWSELDRVYPVKAKEGLTFWRTGRAHYNRIWRHAMRLQIRAQVGVALGCGLRRQELYDQTIITMHYENAYVAVLAGKGGKAREVPHSDFTRAVVREWFDFRDELGPDHDSPWLGLCPLGHGSVDPLKPMHFRRFSELPGHMGPFTLHRFRHTCGTVWLRSGMPLEKVRDLLGHSHISMTLGYAQVVKEDVRRSVDEHQADFNDAVAPPEMRRAA